MASGAFTWECPHCGRTGEGWFNNEVNPPTNVSRCPCGRTLLPEDVTMSAALRNQIRAEYTPDARERARAATKRILDLVSKKAR